MYEDESKEIGDGVWVVYDYDMSPYAKAVYEKQMDVIVGQSALGGHIAFWPHGMELRDAINLWDKYVKATAPNFDVVLNSEKPFGD